MTDSTENKIRMAAAVVIPPIAGTIFVYIGVTVLQEYGWTLFLLLPLVLGFTSTLIYDPKGDKPFGKCLGVGFLSILTIGFLIMITAIEGLVCLAMALPLAAPLIALGVLLGWALTRELKNSRAGVGLSVILFLVMPLFMGFEISNKSTPTVHEVVSTVEIDAPIETVWKNVVEFPEIDEAPQGILRFGFAYPINAHIEGKGVTAVRYCNFNTGAFVEPITAWQEPNLLAFDVRDQPAPMTELGLYENLHVAHLEYLRSQKGQFRLYERDGKTVVEGTTFYKHDIAPDLYWSLFSDEIIHKIHLRVLNHIKEVSERPS